jgi:hypothetical protein
MNNVIDENISIVVNLARSRFHNVYDISRLIRITVSLILSDL